MIYCAAFGVPVGSDGVHAQAAMNCRSIRMTEIPVVQTIGSARTIACLAAVALLQNRQSAWTRHALFIKRVGTLIVRRRRSARASYPLPFRFKRQRTGRPLAADPAVVLCKLFALMTGKPTTHHYLACSFINNPTRSELHKLRLT